MNSLSGYRKFSKIYFSIENNNNNSRMGNWKCHSFETQKISVALICFYLITRFYNVTSKPIRMSKVCLQIHGMDIYRIDFSRLVRLTNEQYFQESHKEVIRKIERNKKASWNRIRKNLITIPNMPHNYRAGLFSFTIRRLAQSVRVGLFETSLCKVRRRLRDSFFIRS